MYSWDFEGGAAGRFCLFNMATKNWQKLDVPAGLIFATADSDYDSTRDDIEYPWDDDEREWDLRERRDTYFDFPYDDSEWESGDTYTYMDSENY